MALTPEQIARAKAQDPSFNPADWEVKSTSDLKEAGIKLARTLGTGATFGALPALEGAVKAIGGTYKGLSKNLKKGWENIKAGKDADREESKTHSEKFHKDYEETRDKSRRSIEEFREEHPKTALAAELVGAVATGLGGGGKAALTKGASALHKIGKTALTSGKFGAAQGLGEAISKGQDLAGTSKDAAKGFAQGLKFGAALGAGGAALSRSAIRPLEKVIGKAQLEHSAKTGESLLRAGNREAGGLADTLVRRNATAEMRDLVGKYGEEVVASRRPTTEKIISDFITPEKYSDKLAKATEKSEAIYKPAYAKLKGVPIDIGNLKSNEAFLEQAKKVVKYSPDLKRKIEIGIKKGKLDADVLQDVRSFLGDEALNKTGREKALLKGLQEQVDDKILNAAENVSSSFKTAKGEYKALKQLADSMKFGKEKFANLDEEGLAQFTKDLASGRHKAEAVKAGVAANFRKKALNRPKDTERFLEGVFPADELLRLKQTGLMSDKQMSTLDKLISKENRVGDTASHLKALARNPNASGDITNMNLVGMAIRPKRAGIRFGGQAISKMLKSNDIDKMKYLTSSGELLRGMQNAGKRSGVMRGTGALSKILSRLSVARGQNE